MLDKEGFVEEVSFLDSLPLFSVIQVRFDKGLVVALKLEDVPMHLLVLDFKVFGQEHLALQRLLRLLKIALVPL